MKGWLNAAATRAWVSPCSLDVPLLLSALVTYWAFRATHHLSLALFLATWGVLLAADLAGALTLALAGVQDEKSGFDAIGCVLCGVFVLTGIAGILFFGARLNALIVGGIVIAATLTMRTLQARQRALRFRSLSGWGLVALVLMASFVTVWSHDTLMPLDPQGDMVVCHKWLDFFFHSMWIGHFSGQSGASLLTTPMLAGTSIPPYHYASYLLPAILGRFGRLSAYGTATGILGPFAFLLVGLSAYTFGRTLGTPRRAVLTTVAAIAFPDPSYYLTGHRWLSYFFFQQVAPSGAEGTALLLLGWTFALRGFRDQRRSFYVLAAATSMFIAVTKTQLFLVYTPLLAAFVAATWPGTRWWIRGSLVSALLLTIKLALDRLKTMADAPVLEGGTSGVVAVMKAAFDRMPEVFQQLAPYAGTHFWRLFFLLAPSLLIAYFGLVLVPVIGGLARPRSGAAERGDRFVPSLVLVNFLICTFFLKDNSGRSGSDPYELVHKTFVAPYLLLACWGALYCPMPTWSLRKWLGAWGVTERAQTVGVALIALAGLGVLMGYTVPASAQLQSGYVFSGSSTYANVAQPRAFIAAGTFIRTHTPPSGVVQALDADRILSFAAFSERHSYVALPIGLNYSPDKIASERAHAVSRIAEAATWAEVVALCHERRIDYLMIGPARQPRWLKETAPIFDDQGYRVVAIPNSAVVNRAF